MLANAHIYTLLSPRGPSHQAQISWAWWQYGLRDPPIRKVTVILGIFTAGDVHASSSCREIAIPIAPMSSFSDQSPVRREGEKAQPYHDLFSETSIACQRRPQNIAVTTDLFHCVQRVLSQRSPTSKMTLPALLVAHIVGKLVTVII